MYSTADKIAAIVERRSDYIAGSGIEKSQIYSSNNHLNINVTLNKDNPELLGKKCYIVFGNPLIRKSGDYLTRFFNEPGFLENEIEFDGLYVFLSMSALQDFIYINLANNTSSQNLNRFINKIPERIQIKTIDPDRGRVSLGKEIAEVFAERKLTIRGNMYYLHVDIDRNPE